MAVWCWKVRGEFRGRMTLGEVTVRPATAEDAGEVRRLSIGFMPGAQDLSQQDFTYRYARLVSDADWCIAVALAGGRLLGYGLAQDFGPGLRTTFTTGRLHDLYVDPEARRLGAGKVLMDFIFRWARSRPQPMILDWQANPSAVVFYEALGFRADRVGDYPDFPGFTLDLRR